MKGKFTVRHAMLLKLIVAVAVIAGFAGVAGAFINPNFSPVHLVEQSDQVFVVKFEGAPKDGKVKAAIVKVLKGEKPKKAPTFDFFAGAHEAQGQLIVRTIAGGTTEAMLFVGFFEDEEGGGDPMGDEEAAKAFLHIAGQWVVLAGFEPDLWDMVKIESRMLGTWAGSTDMLLRVINYVLSDEDAEVPLQSNAEWAKHVKVGNVQGKVRAARPVFLSPDAAPVLFIASEAGDRLYECKGGVFADVTAKHKLTSKSVCAVWLDVNNDGKLDLVSFDGKKLTLHKQGDGGFKTQPLDTGDVLAGGCMSLAYATKEDGEPGVFAGTPGGLVVITIKPDGKTRAKKAPGSVDGMGPGGQCLVADFTGDALPDVLQLFAGGSLLYKGDKPGKLSEPVKTSVALGKGISAACIGDFDQDGLPDVFCTAEDRNRFYQNRGNAKFEDLLVDSGEIWYISKPGGVDAMAGDVNNDGRVDLLIGYAYQAPQIFFNRGFRSFGHARALDLAALNVLEEAGDGQQAACFGDFNNDGAQDMVVVLANGETWCFPRRTLAGAALAVTAVLPMGKPLAQPVTVIGWRGKRCLGGWSVSAGGPVGFVGAQEPGPVTLKWRFPGGKEQSKEILLVDKPARLVLTPKD